MFPGYSGGKVLSLHVCSIIIIITEHVLDIQYVCVCIVTVHFLRDYSYVEVSVKEGGGKDIPCPGFDCSRPVPMVTPVINCY